MQQEYDFSQSVKTPYAKKLKKQMTIRLREEIVAYFKQLAEEIEVPYESLINFYLKGYMRWKRKVALE